MSARTPEPVASPRPTWRVSSLLAAPYCVVGLLGALACGNEATPQRVGPGGGILPPGGGGPTQGMRFDGGLSDGGAFDGGFSSEAGVSGTFTCDSFDANAAGCRVAEDCASAGATCVLDGQLLCGRCRRATRGCEADSCGLGNVCVETLEDCACNGQRSSACRADCRTTAGCANGQRCDANTGVCKRDCFGSAVCSPNASCDPNNDQADQDGCVKNTCIADTDCPCGFCIEARCYDKLGVCAVTMP